MGEAAPGIGFRLVQLAVLLFTIFCSCLEAQESGAASIQPLLKTGDSAIAQGDYDAALRSFEKAQQIAQQMAADSPIRYGVLKRLTSASAASGQFTNAQQYDGKTVSVSGRIQLYKGKPEIIVTSPSQISAK